MFRQRGLAVASRTALVYRTSTSEKKPDQIWRLQVLKRLNRSYCTNLPPEYDDSELVRVLTASQDDLVREVFISASGEQNLTLDPTIDYGNDFDWAEFERRFGLDHDEDNLFDEESLFYDDGEQIRRKTRTKRKKPDGKPEKCNSSADHCDSFTKRDKKGAHAMSPDCTVEYCDEEKPEGQRHTLNLRVASEPITEDGKVAVDEPNILQHAFMEREIPVQRGGKHIPPGVAQTFQQPVNHKRPGYERRVMSMEREMERIAEQVLCKAESTWYKAGANIERLLLSPNMKNLTLFYTIDSQARRPSSWWRKINAKSASSLRAALAQNLKTKYVPRVHFEEATINKTSRVTPAESKLDILFDKIAAEREMRVRTAEESEVGIKD